MIMWYCVSQVRGSWTSCCSAVRRAGPAAGSFRRRRRLAAARRLAELVAASCWVASARGLGSAMTLGRLHGMPDGVGDGGGGEHLAGGVAAGDSDPAAVEVLL